MDRRRALTLLGAALGACGQDASPSDPVVNVAIRPFLTTASFYTAYESGYFEANGLKIQIHQFAQSNKAAALLAAGELDVSLTGLNPSLLSAISQGADIRVVAARDIVSPTCGSVGTIYGRRSAFREGLDDLSRLRGKTIAIQHRASLSEFYLDCLLEGGGLSQSDVRIVILRYPEASAAILSDRIDAMVFSQFEKNLAALSDKIVKGPGMVDLHPYMQYTFVIFGPRLLNDGTDVGARFLAAYFKGVGDYLKGRTPQFLVDFAVNNQMNPEKVTAACRTNVSEDGSVDLTGIRLFADWCVRRGYIGSNVAPGEVVDRRFTDALRNGSAV